MRGKLRSYGEYMLQKANERAEVAETVVKNAKAAAPSEEVSTVSNDKEASKEVDPPKEVVDSKQTNSKRKADVVADNDCSKKQRTGGKSEDSIEAIKEFIQDTDTIMEVDASAPNQEAIDRRRAKRPFQCPVCKVFFISEIVLQQHKPKSTSGTSC